MLELQQFLCGLLPRINSEVGLTLVQRMRMVLGRSHPHNSITKAWVLTAWARRDPTILRPITIAFLTPRLPSVAQLHPVWTKTPIGPPPPAGHTSCTITSFLGQRLVDVMCQVVRLVLKLEDSLRISAELLPQRDIWHLDVWEGMCLRKFLILDQCRVMQEFQGCCLKTLTALFVKMRYYPEDQIRRMMVGYWRRKMELCFLGSEGLIWILGGKGSPEDFHLI